MPLYRLQCVLTGTIQNILGWDSTTWEIVCQYSMSFWMIFETALVSIIFILELSVLDKSCLELNFQAIGSITRVPCMAVFLRSCTLCQTHFFHIFANIHRRIMFFWAKFVYFWFYAEWYYKLKNLVGKTSCFSLTNE